MALSIKNDRADQLARELAALTGESLTDVIVNSLEQRLAEERRSRRRRRSIDDLIDDFKRLPVLDARSEDEILGYDENGLPS
ncbi:MAG: type II toxin-antitoxin system VapB family antitoxin [Actinobacteria bacterium]|nr:type II toxin-antitoxin system VapB family antitoxin [Actinomycetota bacterium]